MLGGDIIEFFIVLFGCMYYAYKLSKESLRNNKYICDSEAVKVKQACLSSKYFVTYEQILYINKFTEENFDKLVLEFSKDLEYIYDIDFVNNPEKVSTYQYYSVISSIRHLLLAKKYKKIYGTYTVYKVSPVKKYATQCIRLFELINLYMGIDECKLIQCPGFNKVSGELTWTVYGSVFKPAAWNLYLDTDKSMSF